MKVEKQRIRLPIGNFEFEGGGVERKKHGKLFPSSIRAIIVGPSNCGKTNLMVSILIAKHGPRFENVYVFSKSSNQAKYNYLEHILKRVKGVGFYRFENQFLKPEEVKKHSICIFDDVITDKQSPIQDFFARGRHWLLDCFYLGQTYSRVPKQLIRDNANLIILFKMDEHNLKHAYNDHVAADMTFAKFREICNLCWQEHHGFIVIDKDSGLNCGGYRKGFDSFIKL